MFRPMRRFKQYLTDYECRVCLNALSSGVLCVNGDGGYPYGVPMSYVFSGSTLYFHCARTGHKLDAIAADPRASFTLTARDDVQSDSFNTLYKSVIAFGRARIADADETQTALALFRDKYCADFGDACDAHIRSFTKNLYVIALDIEHMTGKQSFALAAGKVK